MDCEFESRKVKVLPDDLRKKVSKVLGSSADPENLSGGWGGGVVQGIIVFVGGGGVFFRGQFLVILRYYYVNFNMLEFSGAGGGGGVPRITTLPLPGHGVISGFL